jgi:hypothetical protein
VTIGPIEMSSPNLPTTASTSDLPAGRENAVAYRALPDGTELTLYRMIYTWRLCYGAQGFQTYDRHWCYALENFQDALSALELWDGTGDPPGSFVKSDRD